MIGRLLYGSPPDLQDEEYQYQLQFPSLSQDVRNAMSSGELSSFMESLGISTDDVRTDEGDCPGPGEEGRIGLGWDDL